MVDINLFNDDEDDEKKDDNLESQDNPKEQNGNLEEEFGFGEGDELSGNLDDELGEDLDDDIEKDLEDGLDEEPSLDDDDLLGEEEVPILDDAEETAGDKDYSFGEMKKKGVSLFLLIILGIVAISAAGYHFVIEPKINSLKKLQNEISTNKVADVSKIIKQKQEDLAAQIDTSEAADVEKVTKDSAIRVSSGIKTSEYIDKTKLPAIITVSEKIISGMADNDQLGTVIIDMDGKSFRVGYASEKSNISTAVANRIKNLLNIKECKVSPEEKYKTNGNVRYWGVVSGKFPEDLKFEGLGENKSFVSGESLIKWLKGQVKDYKLTFEQSEIFPARKVSGKTNIPVRIKIRGDRKLVIDYLAVLYRFSGKYTIDKLIITSANSADFSAKEIKSVIDLTLIRS